MKASAFLMASAVLLVANFTATNVISRTPQSISAVRIPVAEELYLRGLFRVQKPFHRVLDENHFGEELDLSRRRPVVNLAGTIFDAKYGRPGTILLANFYHRGQFFIARVPDRGVQSVAFQLAYFPPVVAGKYFAAHSLLRFEFDADRPVEIVAVMPDGDQLARLRAYGVDRALTMLPEELGGEENRIRNVAISAEAQWSKDDPTKAYDLIRGSRGAYIQIVRFVSIQERLEEFYTWGNPVSQVKVETTQGEGDRILHAAFEISERDGIDKLYDTFWYNCTTLAFDIVEAIKGGDRRIGFIRDFMQRRLPIGAPAKLGAHGGIEIAPMQEDESLFAESVAAFKAVQARGSALCTPLMDEAGCRNVTEAVARLNEKGAL